MLFNYRHGFATSVKISQRIRQYPELICLLCFTSGPYTFKGPGTYVFETITCADFDALGDVAVFRHIGPYSIPYNGLE
jgi:hypothetical protein